MHMASIRVRYGYERHSDKPYQTSRRLVRYGLSECHLNPYRPTMDAICIFSHEIPFNLRLILSKKDYLKNQKPRRVRYGLRSELYLTLKLDHGVREIYIYYIYIYITCTMCMHVYIHTYPHKTHTRIIHFS